MGRPAKYPPEFRREAIALVKSSGRAVAEVARSLEIAEGTLWNSWPNRESAGQTVRNGTQRYAAIPVLQSSGPPRLPPSTNQLTKDLSRLQRLGKAQQAVPVRPRSRSSASRTVTKSVAFHSLGLSNPSPHMLSSSSS